MNDNNEQEAPVIYWRIDEWFPELSSKEKTQLKSFHDELIKFNRTISLISAKTLFFADVLHFADAILATKVILTAEPNMSEIYDFGSGGGFPGLVFGILNPLISVKLVEIDLKKAEFLNHMVSTLDLKNVTVINKNVETFEDGSVKFAMARGFNNISRTIMAARKSVVKGGAFFHLKGEEWGVELAEIPTQLCSLWSPSLIGEYKLPVGLIKFAVVKTEKIA